MRRCQAPGCRKPLETGNRRAKFCSSACRSRAHRNPGLRVAVSTDQPVELPLVQRAAASGDRRELLVALRHRLAYTMDDEHTMARDLVSRSKGLVDLAKEIETIDAFEEQEQQRLAVGDEPWDPSMI